MPMLSEAVAKAAVYRTGDLRCLLENLDQLQGREFPIVIVLSRCPHLRNFGFTTAPEVVVDGNQEVRNLISLTKSDLKCLLKNSKLILAERQEYLSGSILKCD